MVKGRSIWSIERAHLRSFRVAEALKLVVCLALLSLLSASLTPRPYSAVQNQQPGKQASGNQEFQRVGRGIDHRRIIRGKGASFIVGGGPQLIKEGRVAIPFEDEKITAKFVSDRHPRTAIARLKDGRMLVATVDARQPGVSAGMSLPELAGLLLEFGGSEAIDLNAGGSTTMIVNGKLVNNPSDQTGE